MGLSGLPYAFRLVAAALELFEAATVLLYLEARGT